MLRRWFLIWLVGTLGALAGPDTELLTELRFDEPSGATAWDRAGRSPGVLHHALRSPGRLAGGLLLNGRNACVEIPGLASVHPQAYTMRLWVRLRTFPRNHNQGWIVLRNRGGDFYEFALKVVSRGTAFFSARIENGNDEQAIEVHSTAAPEIGQWQLLTVTFAEGRLCLYVDGKLAAEGSRPGLVPPRLGTPLILGSGWGSFFAGEIDEFQLADKAWTAEEVASNYRADLADKRPAPKLPESFWLEVEEFSGGWIRASELWLPQGAPTEFSGNGFLTTSQVPLTQNTRARIMAIPATTTVDMPLVGDIHVFARCSALAGTSGGALRLQINETCLEAVTVQSDSWQWTPLGKLQCEPGRWHLRLWADAPGMACDALVLSRQSRAPRGMQLPLSCQPTAVSNWFDADAGAQHVTVPELLVARARALSAKSVESDVRSVREGFAKLPGMRCVWPRLQASVFAAVRDLDGDGLLEAIGPMEADRRTLACIREDGRILWQRSCPVNDYPTDDNLTEIEDLDGDGCFEFIMVGSSLRVLDALTGKTRWERPLPQNQAVFKRFYNKANLAWNLAHVRSRDTWDVAISLDLADGPGVMVFGAVGELVWSRAVPTIRHMRTEHELRALDVDRDGLDEICFSNTAAHVCLDHDGKLLWLIEGRDRVRSHSDFWDMADVDDDGRLEILYQSATTAYVVDALTGKQRLTYQDAEGQRGFLRDFLPELPGIECLVIENRIKLFDAHGAPVWERRGLTGKQGVVGDWDGNGRLDVMFCKYGKPHMAARGDDPDIQVYDATGQLIYTLRWGFKHGGAPWYRRQRYHNARDLDGNGHVDFLIGSYPSGPLSVLEWTSGPAH